MSQLDDTFNSVMILNRKMKLLGAEGGGGGGGGGTLRTPCSCTGYIAITQKYKLGISRNILMYISLCPPEWYQMANFGSLAHRLIASSTALLPLFAINCGSELFPSRFRSIAKQTS